MEVDAVALDTVISMGVLDISDIQDSFLTYVERFHIECVEVLMKASSKGAFTSNLNLLQREDGSYPLTYAVKSRNVTNII